MDEDDEDPVEKIISSKTTSYEKPRKELINMDELYQGIRQNTSFMAHDDLFQEDVFHRSNKIERSTDENIFEHEKETCKSTIDTASISSKVKRLLLVNQAASFSSPSGSSDRSVRSMDLNSSNSSIEEPPPVDIVNRILAHEDIIEQALQSRAPKPSEESPRTDTPIEEEEEWMRKFFEEPERSTSNNYKLSDKLKQMIKPTPPVKTVISCPVLAPTPKEQFLSSTSTTSVSTSKKPPPPSIGAARVPASKELPSFSQTLPVPSKPPKLVKPSVRSKLGQEITRVIRVGDDQALGSLKKLKSDLEKRNLAKKQALEASRKPSACSNVSVDDSAQDIRGHTPGPDLQSVSNDKEKLDSSRSSSKAFPPSSPQKSSQCSGKDVPLVRQYLPGDTRNGKIQSKDLKKSRSQIKSRSRSKPCPAVLKPKPTVNHRRRSSSDTNDEKRKNSLCSDNLITTDNYQEKIKEKTEFFSPLSGMYPSTAALRTGAGYGKQKYKIPKKVDKPSNNNRKELESEIRRDELTSSVDRQTVDSVAPGIDEIWNSDSENNTEVTRETLLNKNNVLRNRIKNRKDMDDTLAIATAENTEKVSSASNEDSDFAATAIQRSKIKTKDFSIAFRRTEPEEIDPLATNDDGKSERIKMKDQPVDVDTTSKKHDHFSQKVALTTSVASTNVSLKESHLSGIEDLLGVLEQDDDEEEAVLNKEHAESETESRSSATSETLMNELPNNITIIDGNENEQQPTIVRVVCDNDPSLICEDKNITPVEPVVMEEHALLKADTEINIPEKEKENTKYEMLDQESKGGMNLESQNMDELLLRLKSIPSMRELLLNIDTNTERSVWIPKLVCSCDLVNFATLQKALDENKNIFESKEETSVEVSASEPKEEAPELVKDVVNKDPSVIKSVSCKPEKKEPVVDPPKTMKKPMTRELSILQKDIAMMQGTKKNKIITFSDVRSCRRKAGCPAHQESPPLLRAYHESDTSDTESTTSSRGVDQNIYSDDGSVGEPRSEVHSREIESLPKKRGRKKGSIGRKRSARSRMKPPKQPQKFKRFKVESESDSEESIYEAVTPIFRKPCPRSVKIRLYGDQSVDRVSVMLHKLPLETISKSISNVESQDKTGMKSEINNFEVDLPDAQNTSNYFAKLEKDQRFPEEQKRNKRKRKKSRKEGKVKIAKLRANAASTNTWKMDERNVEKIADPSYVDAELDASEDVDTIESRLAESNAEDCCTIFNGAQSDMQMESSVERTPPSGVEQPDTTPTGVESVVTDSIVETMSESCVEDTITSTDVQPGVKMNCSVSKLPDPKEEKRYSISGDVQPGVETESNIASSAKPTALNVVHAKPTCIVAPVIQILENYLAQEKKDDVQQKVADKPNIFEETKEPKDRLAVTANMEPPLLHFCDADLSQNTLESQVPRIRVRRLSGDLLSKSHEHPLHAGLPSIDQVVPDQPRTKQIDTNQGFVITDVKSVHHALQKEIPASTSIQLNIPDVAKQSTLEQPSDRILKTTDNAGAVNSVYDTQMTSRLEALKERKRMCLFKCDEKYNCSFSSDSSLEFCEHLSKVHKCKKKSKKVIPKFLKCLYCEFKEFSTPESYTKHIVDEHKFCQYQCAYCNFRACRPIYVHWHLAAKHVDLEKQILVLDTEDNKELVWNNSRMKSHQEVALPFKCAMSCKYSTLSLKEFVDHSKDNHSQIQTWSCYLCTQNVFVTFEQLKHHFFMIHGMAGFQCVYCIFGSTTIDGLKHHLTQSHSSSYPRAAKRREKPSESEMKIDPWMASIESCDLDVPQWKFARCLKVVSHNQLSQVTFYADDDRSAKPHLSLDNMIEYLTKTSVASESDSKSTAQTPEHRIEKSLVEETETERAVNTIVSNPNDTMQNMSSHTVLSSATNSVPPAIVLKAENMTQNRPIPLMDEPVIDLVDSDDDSNDRLVICNDDFEDSSPSETPRQSRRPTTEQRLSVYRGKVVTSSGPPIVGLSGQQLFRCGMEGCSVAVDDFSSFNDHLSTCDNARKTEFVKCPHCPNKLRTSKGFLSHIISHGVSRYRCTLCNFKSATAKKVVDHMKSDHKVQQSIKEKPMNPYKTDKHTDYFYLVPDEKALKAGYDKNYTNSSASNPGGSAAAVTETSEPVREVMIVCSAEEAARLPKELFDERVMCGICDEYGSKVRSNILGHMKTHVTGLVANRDIVNPVPRIDKPESELMFNKMVNHAAYGVKNDEKKLPVQLKQEPNGRGNGEGKSSIPDFVAKNLRFSCSALSCTYMGNDASALKEHFEKTHPQLNDFTCSHCGIKLPITKINLHLRYHSCKLYKCSNCNYVHYQTSGVEKHQEENHKNGECHIVVVREMLQSDAEASQNEPQNTLSSASDAKGMLNADWECCLCSSSVIFPNEETVQKHCANAHRVNYKVKCYLCDFGHTMEEKVDGHIKGDHPFCSQIRIHIYRELHVVKPLLPTQSPQSSNNKSTALLANRPSTEQMHSLIDKLKPVEGTSRWFSDVNVSVPAREQSVNVEDNSNETNNNEPVEPFPDATFRCPLCLKFKSETLDQMLDHCYEEKNHMRFVCVCCGLTSTRRDKLEQNCKHSHQPDTAYIRELTKESWEDKVIQALEYQQRKIISLKGQTVAILIHDSSSDDESISDISVISRRSSTESNGKSPAYTNTQNKYAASLNSSNNLRSVRNHVPLNILKHKNSNVKATFTCSVCRKNFSSRDLLSSHMSATHPSSSTPPNEGTLSRRSSGENTKQKRTKKITSSEVKSGLETCNLCPGKFFRSHELETHKRELHEEFSCLLCNKTLRGEEQLNEHLTRSENLQKSHKPNTECIASSKKSVDIICPFCAYTERGNRYENYERVLRHLKIHLGENGTIKIGSPGSIRVKFDILNVRPITSREIEYLKFLRTTENTPCAVPLKRRAVALKSTAGRHRITSTVPPTKMPRRFSSPTEPFCLEDSSVKFPLATGETLVTPSLTITRSGQEANQGSRGTKIQHEIEIINLTDSPP